MRTGVSHSGVSRTPLLRYAQYMCYNFKGRNARWLRRGATCRWQRLLMRDVPLVASLNERRAVGASLLGAKIIFTLLQKFFHPSKKLLTLRRKTYSMMWNIYSTSWNIRSTTWNMFSTRVKSFSYSGENIFSVK